MKVYIAAIWSLHIEDGLPGWLQHVLRGIKCHQGSNRQQHQSITIEPMHIIIQSLNFSDYNLVANLAPKIGDFLLWENVHL